MSSEQPGKYDMLGEFIFHETDAKCVMLVVVDGNKGSGISVCSISPKTASLLPEILRNLANEMDKDVKKDLM